MAFLLRFQTRYMQSTCRALADYAAVDGGRGEFHENSGFGETRLHLRQHSNVSFAASNGMICAFDNQSGRSLVKAPLAA